MTCPVCGSGNQYCVDSRPLQGNRIRRRRACRDCGHRWSTCEMAENAATGPGGQKKTIQALRAAQFALRDSQRALRAVCDALEGMGNEKKRDMRTAATNAYGGTPAGTIYATLPRWPRR